jgi:hypothetical protein
MRKNKIPIWDNKKDYPADLEFIVSSLLAISDREYQMRIWYKADGPEVDWYSECLLSFETGMDYFKTLLREGKTTLNPLQVKAILRVYVMARHFDNIHEDIPKDWTEQQLYIINHPYWQKVRKQAAHTLSLLKSDQICNKPLQIYGSVETRTANQCPNLACRFADRMKVFGDRDLRETWKDRDDFWDSVARYAVVHEKFFDGLGSLPSGRHLRSLIAFHDSLSKLCEPYEDDGGDLKTILADPNFHEVEQKAQDFLKLVSPNKQTKKGQ